MRPQTARRIDDLAPTPLWTPQAEIVDLARRELAGNPNGAEHGGRECRRRRWHDLTTPTAGYNFRDGQ